MRKPTRLRTDGSKLNGISVVLQQETNKIWRTVACKSRFLKLAEKNYWPIELEMLAVTWGCEVMNMYLHGLPKFIICTDHKPLIPILNSKMLCELSARIQWMRMKLLKYSFEAEYCKGKDLIDAFSRAPTQEPTEQELADAKEAAMNSHWWKVLRRRRNKLLVCSYCTSHTLSIS